MCVNSRCLTPTQTFVASHNPVDVSLRKQLPNDCDKTCHLYDPIVLSLMNDYSSHHIAKIACHLCAQHNLLQHKSNDSASCRLMHSHSYSIHNAHGPSCAHAKLLWSRPYAFLQHGSVSIDCVVFTSATTHPVPSWSLYHLCTPHLHLGHLV